jgi:hypothetical protein
MNPWHQFVVVIFVFAGITFGTTALALLIFKLKLLNVTGALFFSLGVGLLFGGGYYILILISEKFESFSASAKLFHAAQIFLIVFFIVLISSPLYARRFRIKS